MEYFSICQGIPIHISDTKNEKPAIVLLHGYLETLSVWDSFSKYLEPAFRIIRIDLPGHGLSGSLPDRNSIDFSAQVVSDILERLCIKTCCMVGHSMGGYIALAFAANNPEKLSGLCLFHSSPNADSAAKRDDRDREIALVRAGKLPLVVRQSIPQLFAEENIKRFSTVIEELTEVAGIHDPEGIVACLEGMKDRPDRNDLLKDLQSPVCFIFGEKDRHIPLAASQEIAARFPLAKIVWLKNSGHAGFFEEPAICAEQLTTFITSLRLYTT